MAHSTEREPSAQVQGNAVQLRPARPRYLTVAWMLLLVLGTFFLFAAASDLAADARTGLPSDHLSTFAKIAGTSWESAKQSTPALTEYVTLLEVAYAMHELVFGILFTRNPRDSIQAGRPLGLVELLGGDARQSDLFLDVRRPRLHAALPQPDRRHRPARAAGAPHSGLLQAGSGSPGT